jgi:signal transduction histidine kinase
MPQRILIVSDDAVRIGVTRAALAAAGHIVEVAADLDLGLSVAGTFVPRFVAVDAKLRGFQGAGPTLVERFRAASQAPVGVVALEDAVELLVNPVDPERARLLREAERRNELVCVLAHELRGPLAPIITAAVVLRRKPEDVAAVTRASITIERQARHLARMANDLLDASRLAHGKVKLVRERLDVVALAREVAADHKDSHDAVGLSLSIQASVEALHVAGDRTRLSQVFGNLLANAVKFTPRGGAVHIEVSARSASEVAVSVRDTGVGIPADMIPRLFQPFEQAEHSLERAAGGLGLGLSVVKGLVELHGGRVTVISAGTDRGSEFTVILPREPHAEPAEVAVAEASPPAASSAAGCRVLVVDDNRDTAQTLAEFLDIMGYTTEVAHTGNDGVEKALRFAPHVVLCDIGLPGMDGYAVAAALRARAVAPAAKLVALTGYGSEGDVARARAAGFDRHVTKPVMPDALLGILAELVVPPEAPTALQDVALGAS